MTCIRNTLNCLLVAARDVAFGLWQDRREPDRVGMLLIKSAQAMREVGAERLRRHPDQAYGPFLPAFASVVETVELCPAIHHRDHSHELAAA